MSQNVSSSDVWRPTATWDVLRSRAALLSRLRRFFDEREFLEVETPLLSADVVVDRHIDPLAVVLPDDPRQPERGARFWLQTSPEFAMKRLLAAGGRAIYQVCKAFRAAERGQLHNPEFTIVEWYRVDDDAAAGRSLLGELALEMLAPVMAPRTGSGASSVCQEIPYAEAFERHVGLDPHRATVDALADAARRRGLAVPESIARDDRDAWLELLLRELVEPQLGQATPEILFDYPVGQAALAKVRPGDPAVAERFELYYRGVELANGYHELRDPEVLRRRSRESNRLRQADGKPPLPEESLLLSAMETGLPPCAGCALGFDRLAMLVAGACNLDEVLAFPIERA